MISMNPNMASAINSLQSTSQPAPVAQQPTEMQNSTSSSASSTVSLSSGQPQNMVDYTNLNNQQTVRNSTQVEQTDINANQSTSGTTYASSLQNTSSYYLMPQSEPSSNSSGNPTENMANQNANLASE